LQTPNSDKNGLAENDRHENDGPKITAGRKVAGEEF